jgi:hypothetical protein
MKKLDEYKLRAKFLYFHLIISLYKRKIEPMTLKDREKLRKER